MSISSKRVKGKLYTCNPNGLQNIKEDAELWQITRAGKTIPNTIIARDLSPSSQLFNTFMTKWRHLPPESWWHLYEKQFKNELNSEEKLGSLRLIYRKLLEGKNIVLVCFCKDQKYCHRRLVGEFFYQYGIKSEELNPLNKDTNNSVEQLTLFME